jgi:hypothetical protein
MDMNQEVEQALKAISGSDMCAAEKACALLEEMVRDRREFEVIDRVREAGAGVKTNFLVFLRFMKLLCGIFSLGEEEFRHCDRVGAVGDVVAFCTTDDRLVQMNTIDLLVYLTNTYHGLEYLCNHNLLLWLITTVNGGPTGPDPLIGAHAMRVLGKVFQNAENKRFDLMSNMSSELVDRFLNRMRKHFLNGNDDEKITGECTWLNVGVGQSKRFLVLSVLLVRQLLVPLRLSPASTPPRWRWSSRTRT